MSSERLERLAAELIAVAEQIRQTPTAPPEDEPGEGAARGIKDSGRAATLDRWRDLATQIYYFRRRRDRLFGNIFGEPGWDMLLDLFIMEARGKRVPVSSACIASGASHSTALRLIDELVRSRLLVRERDEHDKRRTYLRLSDEGICKLVLSLKQSGEQCVTWGHEASGMQERVSRRLESSR